MLGLRPGDAAAVDAAAASVVALGDDVAVEGPSVVWSDHACWRYRQRAHSANLDPPTREIEEAIAANKVSRRHASFFTVTGSRVVYMLAWRLGGRTAVVVTVLRRHMVDDG